MQNEDVTQSASVHLMQNVLNTNTTVFLTNIFNYIIYSYIISITNLIKVFIYTVYLLY